MKYKLSHIILAGILLTSSVYASAQSRYSEAQDINIPTLQINGDNSHKIVKAYRIAIGDIMSNVQDIQFPQEEQGELPCLYAGLAYDTPWTRDAAINVWNGFYFLSPNISKNTLARQLTEDSTHKLIIGGQYWDKVIWGIGAWSYYLYSGDRPFLQESFEALKNTLQIMKKEEYSPDLGLFRGPAVYGDGVSAYPAIYTRSQEQPEESGRYSGIVDWVPINGKLKAQQGYGLPMHALSTNLVYYQAYVLLSKMASELGEKVDPQWTAQAQKLKHAINTKFWNKKSGRYNYLVDSFGGCQSQEGLGLAFSMLFDVADSKMKTDIFKNTIVKTQGIPCVYPSFERYATDKDKFGRHSGTVWPFVQGFWADAAASNGEYEIFSHEFHRLTENAYRDGQFSEIYHPISGTPYGGLQEPKSNDEVWFCGRRQTWSATAYLRMILFDIAGISIKEQGLQCAPYLPEGIHSLALLDLHYRDMKLNIHLKGCGAAIQSIVWDGNKVSQAFIPNNLKGDHTLTIMLAEQ